jgi:hypothetical protein
MTLVSAILSALYLFKLNGISNWYRICFVRGRGCIVMVVVHNRVILVTDDVSGLV